MLESLFSLLVVTFLLGLVTWHAARVLADGVLFESLRDLIDRTGYDTCFYLPDTPTSQGSFKTPREGLVAYHARSLSDVVGCRLCLNTQAAVVFTWGALVTIMTASWYQTSPVPLAYWFFAFTVGPFLTAAWAEVIRRVEGIEV